MSRGLAFFWFCRAPCASAVCLRVLFLARFPFFSLVVPPFVSLFFLGAVLSLVFRLSWSGCALLPLARPFPVFPSFLSVLLRCVSFCAAGFVFSCFPTFFSLFCWSACVLFWVVALFFLGFSSCFWFGFSVCLFWRYFVCGVSERFPSDLLAAWVRKK